MIAALHAQVTLLAESNVTETAKALMDCLPSTYAPAGQRSDEHAEDAKRIAALTRELVAAMAAEIRS